MARLSKEDTTYPEFEKYIERAQIALPNISGHTRSELLRAIGISAMLISEYRAGQVSFTDTLEPILTTRESEHGVIESFVDLLFEGVSEDVRNIGMHRWRVFSGNQRREYPDSIVDDSLLAVANLHRAIIDSQIAFGDERSLPMTGSISPAMLEAFRAKGASFEPGKGPDEEAWHMMSDWIQVSDEEELAPRRIIIGRTVGKSRSREEKTLKVCKGDKAVKISRRVRPDHVIYYDEATGMLDIESYQPDIHGDALELDDVIRNTLHDFQLSGLKLPDEAAVLLDHIGKPFNVMRVINHIRRYDPDLAVRLQRKIFSNPRTRLYQKVLL